MASRLSRLDKAKAERERLLAQVEEQRLIVSAAQEQISAAEGKIMELQAEILEADSFIRGWDRFGEGERDLESGFQRENPSTDVAATTGGRFYGKGLPAASTLVVQMSGREMTAKEVAEELRRGGVRLAAKDPVRSVEWALSRSADHGHVVKIGKAWACPATQLEVPEIDSETRSSRTRAGLALARERGVRIGRPSKLTEEDRRQAISMWESGQTITDIAKVLGISRGGLVRRVREWRDEGRWSVTRKSGRRSVAADRDRGMVH